MPAERKYRVFVLGAGFSRPAGLLLADELWKEVLRRARLMYGRASKFNDDLETYIEFRKDCDGLLLTPGKVNFEDFLAFLDIEHHLGFRGSDTWSEDGNESQVIIKTLIGRILTERMPQTKDLPDLYLRFAEALQPDDYVITFNYDVALERALEIIGKPFRLFPSRYKNVYPEFAEVDDSREEVIVLKVHGSIDWFDRTKYRTFSESRLRQGLTSPTPDPVFNNPDLTVIPLVTGPRFPNDPLREIHRVLQIERLYAQNQLFRATPTLLSPSTMKILYSEKVKQFWWGFDAAGILNLGLAIIGFSLPEQDNYARQAIYRLVRNYQRANKDIESLGYKKSPLVIVDLRRTKGEMEEFKRRYAFVDWTRAVSYFNGFDEEALELIFQQS